jgi:hypothetical protein
MRLDARVCTKQHADAGGDTTTTAEDRAVAQEACGRTWEHERSHVRQRVAYQVGHVKMCMLLGVAGVVARIGSWQ